MHRGADRRRKRDRSRKIAHGENIETIMGADMESTTKADMSTGGIMRTDMSTETIMEMVLVMAGTICMAGCGHVVIISSIIPAAVRDREKSLRSYPGEDA